MSISTKKVQKKLKSDHSVFRKQENSKSSLNKQNSSAQDILTLHQTIGNQAVQRLYKTHTIQAKLVISQPDDKYEKEADNMADKVMRMPESTNDNDKEEVLLETKKDELIQPKREENSKEVSSNIEVEISALKGQGEPLPKETKNFFESRFGANFSKVRVHHNTEANQLARKLNARAFTKGHNIVFNSGEYNPHSEEGKKLLAHELTHIRQQRGSLKNTKIYRVKRLNQNEAKGIFTYKNKDLTTTFSQNKFIHLPLLSLPNFKSRNSKKIKLPLKLEFLKKGLSQRELWDKEIKVNTNIEKKLAKVKNSVAYKNNNYFFKGRERSNFNIFGTEEQIKKLAKIPIWDKKLNPTRFEVDHIKETQLGGENTMSNFELLESSANASSGSSIMWEINHRLFHAYNILNSQTYQNQNNNPYKPKLFNKPKKTQSYKKEFLKNKYQIEFKKVKYDLETKSGKPERFWSVNSIEKGKHFKNIIPMSAKDMSSIGKENTPLLFISPFGGKRLSHSPKSEWLPRVDLLQKPDFTKKTLQVSAYKTKDKRKVGTSYSKMDWYLKEIPGIYGFYVNKKATLRNATKGKGVFQSLKLPGMSLIKINQLDLTHNGFYGVGKVLPTIPLIKNADIDIVIDSDSIRLRKLFNIQEFKFPPPFMLKNATLEASFGTKGLGLAGQVDFGINNIGEGHIGATKSKSKGFELEGEFNFDSELFKPALIHMSYKNKLLEGGGELGIPKGKIKGIKEAHIIASYRKGDLSASGEVDLDIPGIDKGKMDLKTTKSGFSVEGEFLLKPDIPGIKSGKVKASITKKNNEYSVSVSGKAKPNIPGIDSDLSIDYIDGALTLRSKVKYKKGMLSGDVDVTISNKKVSKDGKPTKTTGKKFYVYGGGNLSLKLTPWLQATAGVRFLKNGELEVQGKIGLPATQTLFKRKEIKRALIKPKSIDIPIFAIPVGPKSIGIIARISGGLSMKAGFGPGELRALEASIIYNPKHEENTKLNGHGKFVIPADAGLELTAQLGLGASVVIASITGGIELVGTLGVKGEAVADVDVNWSPKEGIKLDAKGSIIVQPKFKFDINAYAKATLDLWVKEFSKTWRKNLKSFEWGPNVQFGLVFPIHYESKKPFNISYKDIQIIYPNLNITKTAKGLASDVKKKIF